MKQAADMRNFYERMLQPTTVLTAAATALALAAYFFKPGKKKYNLPPYPWLRLPIIGNMISLMLSKEKAYINFYKKSKEEKLKMFMIQIGASHICILNHIDVVKEAFRDKPADFAGRPKLHMIESMGLENSISAGTYTPKWKFQRKVAHTAIRKFALGARLEESLQDSVMYFISEIQKHGEEPFVIKFYLECLVFNMITGILFGKTYAYDDEEFQVFRDTTRKAAKALGSGVLPDIFPLFGYIPFQDRSMKNLVKPYHQLINTQVREHQERFDRDSLNDLVDYLLHAQEEAEEEESNMRGILNDKTISNTIFDIIGASLDTLNQTLQCLVARAAMHPDIQEKVYQEVNQVLGDQLPVGSHRSSLPQTEAFIYEHFRSDGVAAISFPLTTMCDTTLGGYMLPKDTWVSTNFWALHHDPDYWEEPEKFNPNRFLDESGQIFSRPESFYPFSGGKRVCLGESLAKSALLMIVAMLFQKLKFVKPKNFSFEFESGFGSGITKLPKKYEIIVETRE